MKRNTLKVALALVITSLCACYRNSERSNVYAILLNTSKFWFNYRQITNTLMFYKLLKQNGIPDENVSLCYYFAEVYKILLLDSAVFT